MLGISLRGALVAALLIAGAPLVAPVALDQQDYDDRVVTGTTVRGETLRGAWVRAATVEDSTLERVAISDSTVRGGRVTAALLAGVTLVNVDVRHAWVEFAGIQGGALTDVTVHNSTLTDVALTRVTLCNVEVTGQGRVDTGCNGATGARGPATPATPGTPGTPTPAGQDDIFARDTRTLAVFELNGNVQDSSGNARHAGLTDAPDAFVESRFGRGLTLTTVGPGIVWTDYAGLLRHPFTIEMVFVPDSSSGYRKFFSPQDSADLGWYNLDGAFVAYPSGGPLGPGAILANSVNYVAFVSTSSTDMDVYVNGVLVGSTPMQFTAPPDEAIFFRDDRNGSEQFTGTVDAIRISTGSRTPAEIAGVMDRIGD